MGAAVCGGIDFFSHFTLGNILLKDRDDGDCIVFSPHLHGLFEGFHGVGAAVEKDAEAVVVLNRMHVGVFHDGHSSILLGQECHRGACNGKVRLRALASVHTSHDDISVVGLSNHPECLLSRLILLDLLLDEASLA